MPEQSSTKHASSTRPDEAAPPVIERANKRRLTFGHIAAWTTRITGGRWGFLTALGVVILWAISGVFLHYSEFWQIVINTITSIVTFLMVFLIQNAQNRDSKAIHLKLDELLYALRDARNELIHIEELTEGQLDLIKVRYTEAAQDAHERLGPASLRAVESETSNAE